MESWYARRIAVGKFIIREMDKFVIEFANQSWSNEWKVFGNLQYTLLGVLKHQRRRRNREKFLGLLEDLKEKITRVETKKSYKKFQEDNVKGIQALIDYCC